jgi:hypothetical protein
VSSLSKTLMNGKPWLYETVKSGPEDHAFDSILEPPSGPGQNYKLRIVLRVYLHQINPELIYAGFPGLNFALKRDWDQIPKLIRAWSPTDWTNFIRSFRRQAAQWDSKLWLVPPNEVGWFDVVSSGTRTRPNIKCEFQLEVTPSKYGAHQTVDAINLATGNFRSDSGTFTSADTVPESFSNPDRSGATVNTQQDTLTHETGHLLGLDHINQLRNDPTCGIAILYEQTRKNANDQISKITPDNSAFNIPAITSARLVGGIGSAICYGQGGTADAINNVMGYGSRFTAEEARPWLGRLPEHLNLSGQDAFDFGSHLPQWTVALRNTPPRIVH